MFNRPELFQKPGGISLGGSRENTDKALGSNPEHLGYMDRLNDTFSDY